ncbi:MAG: ABC transporter ATP-binding protein [Ignavibacteriales bacterium]|nr:ABC transporter ATP-binding protein [Ignavibacteriales bacterium]
MIRENVPQQVAELVDVTKEFGFDGQRTLAVRDCSLQVMRGELVLLLGPSGSGKTTLLTLIAGLTSASSGNAVLFGRSVEEYSGEQLQSVRGKRLGFIFQNFLLLDFLTVVENIALVLQFAGSARTESRQKAAQLLKKLEIEHLSERFPASLSQGEKQRVAIARAIANDAELILADEPTASLESAQGFAVIRLLHRLAKEWGKCVVVASHDLRLKEFADRVLYMQDGRIGTGIAKGSSLNGTL